MGDIKQSVENKAFAEKELAEGCKSGIYQEVSARHTKMALRKGAIASFSFVLWQEGFGNEKKGRFVVNLSKQSKKWKKITVKTESLSEFLMSGQKGDCFLFMDI